MADIDDAITGDDLEQVEIDLGEETKSAEEPELNLDFGPADEPVADDFEVTLEDPEEKAKAEEAAVALDEAAEAAIEELRQELIVKPGDWYVVHTYSGMENRVKQNIESRVRTLNVEDYIFEAVVPTEEVDEIRNGARKRVTRTVLPGYVLLRMELTDESWSAVRHGVLSRLSVPEQATVTRKRPVEVSEFEVGDSVIINYGPFNGMEGTIDELLLSSSRLKVMVNFLGRDTSVDLKFDQVTKA